MTNGGINARTACQWHSTPAESYGDDKFVTISEGWVVHLSLSDEGHRVRDRFVEACGGAGCEVTMEDMGSMFASWAVRDDTAASLTVDVGPID